MDKLVALGSRIPAIAEASTVGLPASCGVRGGLAAARRGDKDSLPGDAASTIPSVFAQSVSGSQSCIPLIHTGVWPLTPPDAASDRNSLMDTSADETFPPWAYA